MNKECKNCIGYNRCGDPISNKNGDCSSYQVKTKMNTETKQLEKMLERVLLGGEKKERIVKLSLKLTLDGYLQLEREVKQFISQNFLPKKTIKGIIELFKIGQTTKTKKALEDLKKELL